MVGTVERAGAQARSLQKILLPKVARDLPLLPTAEHTLLIGLAALIGLYAAFAASLLRVLVHLFDAFRHLDDVRNLWVADSGLRLEIARRLGGYELTDLLLPGTLALVVGVAFGVWRDLRRRRRGGGDFHFRSRGYHVGALLFIAALVHPALRIMNVTVEALGIEGGQREWWVALLIAAGGGLIVGYLHRFAAGEESGVPRVMSAVALEGGAIDRKEGLGFAAGSAATVSAGGSVGLEGPVVVFGATAASSFGRFLGLGRSRVRVLAAAGAAAGIAAAFNAPIAGAMFALEIIVGDFALGTFSPVVIASVVGAVVHRSLEGNHPVLTGVSFSMNSGWEILLYIGLGLTCAVVGTVLVKAVEGATVLGRRWTRPLPVLLRPVVGLVVVVGAARALGLPSVLGSGYGALNGILDGGMMETALVVFIAAKIIATAATFGGGGLGGVMFPALSIGAGVGALYGTLASRVIDGLASPASYAVVGMGALLTAVQQAPLTAIVLVFEFTNDDAVILPIMVSAILSTLLATRALGGSLYHRVLRGAGIVLNRGREQNVLRALHVEDIMDHDVEIVPASMRLGAVVTLVQSGKQTTFPVVDDAGVLTAVFGAHDLREVWFKPELADLIVAAELGVADVKTVHRGDSLAVALDAFSLSPFEHLVVVDPQAGGKVVGLISLHSAVAYYQEQLRRAGIGSATEPPIMAP